MMNSRVGIALFLSLCLVLGAWFATHRGSLNIAGFRGTHIDISEQASPFLGKAGAPVAIVEYADFQCPSCAVFHFGAGAALLDEYVKAGKASFTFKEFPLLGEESFLAAYAAMCANAQGKFWQYHDALFDAQSGSGGENTGTFLAPNLKRIAADVGLNTDTFSDCLDRQTYKNAVAQDIAEGQAAGVTGTPTVFINGQKVEGLAALDIYQNIIDAIIH